MSGENITGSKKIPIVYFEEAIVTVCHIVSDVQQDGGINIWDIATILQDFA